MGAQSIKIPVELELSNLRNSISTLQNALKKIDPNSKQYENLSKALNKVEQQYRSLENASKRTFKNTTEINNFEKTFTKFNKNNQRKCDVCQPPKEPRGA